MVILRIIMAPSFMVYLENFSLASLVPQNHCGIGQSDVAPALIFVLRKTLGRLLVT